MSNMKYRIRHKETGLFVGGSRSSPKYFRMTKRGFTWGSRPALRDHKQEFELAGIDYTKLEVVEYQLIETGTSKLI